MPETGFPRMSLLGHSVNRGNLPPRGRARALFSNRGMCLDPAREARPGYGLPDRVSGSQTLEALVEAKK